MARASREVKKLAQRIELDYFKRRHPLRSSQFVLSVALSLAGVGWLAWAGMVHDQSPYNSGPLSAAHALFASHCAACHVTAAQSFRRKITDHACLSCHDGPIHHANQSFTPACADCHVEHRGRVLQAQTRDLACTQCHANLTTTSGLPHVERVVLSFVRHPEFAPLRAGFRDPGTIKLNHLVHLNPNLRGPDGRPVQLICSDCHRPSTVEQAWRYGLPGAGTVLSSVAPVVGDAPHAIMAQAYMAPPKFAQACVGCHPLLFDRRFKEPVPHDRPEIVHVFVVKRFTQYIALHPGELRERAEPPRLPEKPVLSARHIAPEQWVTERVAEAERLLWEKTCKECHTLVAPPGEMLPAVAASAITARWLPHALFNHDAHRLVACIACHANASTSQETADVLVPGVGICQQCHRTANNSAEARCVECHTYHDWRRQKEQQAPYSIPALTGLSRERRRLAQTVGFYGLRFP